MRKLGTNPKKIRRMDKQRRKYGSNMERIKEKVEEAIPKKKRRYSWTIGKRMWHDKEWEGEQEGPKQKFEEMEERKIRERRIFKRKKRV